MPISRACRSTSSLTTGTGALFGALHDLFDHDYAPTALHRLLAELPSVLRAKSLPPALSADRQHQLRRPARAGVQGRRRAVRSGHVHLRRRHARQVRAHRRRTATTRIIDIPNQYRDLSLERRTIILKIHGAVNRAIPDGEGDSYVITEDHYIDYLTRTDLANLIPVTLTAKLRKSHFLFLGYGLRDWNLRVILHRIAGEQRLNYKSWAIQRASDRARSEVLGPPRRRHPRHRSRALHRRPARAACG